MKITSTYSVRLRNFNLVFDDTVEVYRHAVDYFIELVMANWNTHFANLSHANGERQKFCVHGIIGARQTGASNEHEHQTQFS